MYFLLGFCSALVTYVIFSYFEYRRAKRCIALIKAQKAESPPPVDFAIGDWVTLKGPDNPYKGTLSMNKTYEVFDANNRSGYLLLRGNNDDIGCYNSEHFQKLGYDPDPPGAQEYEEIMQIQELTDGNVQNIATIDD